MATGYVITVPCWLLLLLKLLLQHLLLVQISDKD
jgi:hypothetical protein